MLETLSSYASLINAVLAMVILGVLLNLSKLHSDVLKDRLEGAKDQSNWNRERFEAERAAREQLRDENEQLRITLQEALSKEGVTLTSIASGAPLVITGRDSDPTLVQELAERLERQSSADPAPSPQIHLELAKADMAQGNWESAAKLLDRYVSQLPDSFEVQIARGVAWANTRKGDLSALRAYNEAIAFLKNDERPAKKAQVFTYRAAVLKRLGRLDEASYDLEHALDISKKDQSGHVSSDLFYNLAAVSAMKGDKRRMLESLYQIRQRKYSAAVQAHLEDYFKGFQDDPELCAWITQTTETFSA